MEDSMRRFSAIPLALAATLTLGFAPALALDRLAAPGLGGTAVTRVADLDRPAHPRRHYGVRSHGHWRTQAAYTRWLHNEYVVAGYPVNQYRSPTYYLVYPCCARRHWHW
jgi:hypothetical protein